MTKMAVAATMRMEEWKAQAMDTAPYNEEHKKAHCSVKNNDIPVPSEG